MRKRKKLRWLGAALLGLAGCQSTADVQIKPTHQNEDYVVPADGDPRFAATEGMKYPKGTLFDDVLQKPLTGPNDPSKGPNMGMGPAAGGMRPGGGY
jgi:hypothetical protein